MCAPTARNTASNRPALCALEQVHHLGIELERDAEIDDALDLGIEHLARQPVLRNAEAHHAARHRTGLANRHAVAEPREMIGGRESRWAGTNDQHALAGRRQWSREFPVAPQGFVTEEALDRVDADALVELGAIARGFARVIADAAHHGRQRIVLRQHAPCVFVVTRLGMEQPALDVLARGAGVIAGRQPVDVLGAHGAPRARCGSRGSSPGRA